MEQTVTYESMFTFALLIISLIKLIISINNQKK